jgi:hypothetical protein
MKEPEPEIRLGDNESPFIQFAKTLRGLIAVSKREVEEAVAKEKAVRKQRRERKRG